MYKLLVYKLGGDFMIKKITQSFICTIAILAFMNFNGIDLQNEQNTSSTFDIEDPTPAPLDFPDQH